MQEELIGQLDFIRHVFQPDDDEQRTVIAVLADGSTIKGQARRGDLDEGLSYRFQGSWKTHPKYGKQFCFASYAITQPVSKEGMLEYLSRARGIGFTRAESMWRAYGEKCLEVLRTQPGRVAVEIAGITPRIANEAAEYFREHQRLESVTVELVGVLGKHGFPRSLVDELIQKFGAAAADEVRKNAYSLMLFRGVGFLKADKLFLELGGKADDLERQARCAWHVIHKDSEGHTWHPAAKAYQAVAMGISGVDASPEAAVKTAVEMGILVGHWVSRKVGGRVSGVSRELWLAEPGKAIAEQRVAEFVRKAEKETPESTVAAAGGDSGAGIRWPDVSELQGLGDDQRRELSRAFQGRIGILAGRPGTGKTFCLARVIEWLSEHGEAFVVCAPTGKAAVRISESLANMGLTVDVRTIHSTLGMRKDSAPAFNEHCPLPVDFILVDEVSMVPTDLMAQLLAARDSGTLVLLVGDPDQLPPVGHGAPLRDLIAAGVPCGHLTEIRRNGGRVVQVCKEIAENQVYEPSAKLDIDNKDFPENLVHWECRTEDQLGRLEKLCKWAAGTGEIDPVWDVQVLCTVNGNSPVSRKALNTFLQEKLNKDGVRVAGNPFRVGDKVICLENKWLKRLVRGKPGKNGETVWDTLEEEVFCANGEQAKVLEVAETFTIVELQTTKAVVRVPRGKPKAQNNGENDDEGDAGDQDTGKWALGFAITCHKSQGSEFPLVAVMVDSSRGARMICDRHHVYTGISRLRTLGVTIGSMAVVQEAVKKSNMWHRKTRLVGLLEELRKPSAEELVELWERDLEELANSSSNYQSGELVL